MQQAPECRVLISFGQAAQGHEGSDSKSWVGRILNLKHPQTGQDTAFLLQNKCLQEFNWFKQEFASWFAGNRVIQDGGLYLCSAIDPLFLALPIAEANRRQVANPEGVYRDAEQLLHTDDLQDAADLRELAGPHLPLLCDTKSAGGDTYYRLSDAKVLAWLRCKVTRLVAALTEAGGTFSGMDLSGLQAYAVGMLSEYLSAAWHKKLETEYSLERGEEEPLQPRADYLGNADCSEAGRAEKRIKLDPKELAKKRATEARLESKAAQLKKETAGMRKMSSFFAAKPK